MRILKKLFVSAVRIKILDLMLLDPTKSLHVRAIVRRVGAEINAVRRELENLTNIGLFTRRRSSNRLYYTVDTNHVFYSELLSLLSKERGLGAEIIKNIDSLGDVEFAILSLEFLRGRKATALDVDLFLVGDIDTEALELLVKVQEKVLNREVNFSVMASEDFRHRKRKHDQFVFKVLAQGRCMLVGDDQSFHSIV